MSFSVDQAFAAEYQSFLIHHLQQMKPRLKGAAREKTGVRGASTTFNLLDDSDPYTITRHGDTIWANDAHSNVSCTLFDYGKFLPIDKTDELKTLVNLESEYTKNILAAFARQYDKMVVVKGLTQSAGTYTVTGTTNAGLTFADVAAAAGLAEDLEWPEDDRYFGWTGAALDTLLQQTQVGSADYNSLRAIQSGRFNPDDMFMGFKWRKLNQAHLASASKRTGAVGSVTAETVYAWHKDAIGVAVGLDVTVDIGVRRDKNLAKQVGAICSIGACKIDGNRIIDISLDY